MTKLDTPDQRRFSRVPFLADAHIQIGPTLHPCTMLDIALKGALIEIAEPKDYSQGDLCRLVLTLSEQTDQQIIMEGKIVHLEDSHLGIEWRHIDLDSLINLRRLLELKHGDDAFLERELHELLRLV